MTEDMLSSEETLTEDPICNIAQSDTNASEEPPKENIETLKEEILLLKNQISELESTKKAQERMLEEISDLHALFPEADIEAIPEGVWESVKNGCPLPAAYALYQKRVQAEADRIAKINSKNASCSPGTAGKNTVSEYFSPDEVRKMSHAEVHANYSKIKESMKKWM